MARIVLVIALISVISISTGCRLDTAGSHLMPHSTTTIHGSATPIDMSNMTEADLAEQVALTRQQYQQALELIVDFYGRMGDNSKLKLARSELRSFKKVPAIDYIGGVIPPANLRGTSVIPEANNLYEQAKQTYDQATKYVVWKRKGQMVLAADKFKQLIRQYPNSEKIDDAAFHLGLIYETFKDYSLACTYYQRAYQWDTQTPHPARFRAANILDKYLNEKEQALELFQAAVTAEGTRHIAWREHAQERIQELTVPGDSN